MTEQKRFKQQTTGNFNITGYLTVDDKTFTINSQGKNNANWISNIFNPKIEGENGQSMFIRIQDGFDKVKGKDIYASTKDSNDSLIIPFRDRQNENIISQVNDMSFIKIALEKSTKVNEDSGKEYKEWNYKKFLTVYDAIAFLQNTLQIGEKFKVRITGRTRYSMYNGSISRNYELQSLYLLPDDDKSECNFKFTQNVLLTKDSLDTSHWDESGIAKLNAKIYQKKKKDIYEVLILPIVIKAKENKETYNKVIEKYLSIKEGVVRKIKIEGIYNCGYVAGEVKEEDLPSEALELIELGLYSKEEVLKKYAVRERIDEMLFKRPVIIVDSQTNLPKVDFSDTDYTPEDLKNLIVEAEKEEIILQEDEVDQELMNELNDL